MGIRSFDKSNLDRHSLHVHTRHENVGFEMHRHEYFEMIYYSGCRGEMHINGVSYEIRDECIFLLTPTDFHEIDAAGGEGSRSVVISFAESVIDEAIFRDGAVQPSALYMPEAFLCAAFDKMLSLYSDAEPLALSHLINYALSEITRHGAPVNPDNSYVHPKIREAVSYLMANMERDCSLEAISERVGLSPSYFSAKFSEVMKKPYKAWLIEARIARARRMLEGTDEPILDIAYECGYNDPSHFIRVFKNQTGYTPKAYRKTVKK